jgi:hypothetical protein
LHEAIESNIFGDEMIGGECFLLGFHGVVAGEGEGHSGGDCLLFEEVKE